MMSFYDKCQQVTVKVNGGSGVLFQPMTEEYSYILTAKHTLYQDEETMHTPIEENSIEAIGIEVEFIKKYEHNELDIAILKIEKVNIETPLKEFEEVSKSKSYELYGYPGYKRNENVNIEEQIENFEVSLSSTSRNKVTLDNPKFSTIAEIKGVSGGGVFREVGELIYLVAIEYEMNAKKNSIATHQRIDAISIEAFEKIIDDNRAELVPLYPPYMNDFNLLLDDIFLLNGLMIEKEKVITFLKDIAKNDIKCNISPKEIHDLYKDKLFSKEEYINELLNKELWVRYFEFLVLSKLIDNDEICIDNIDKIYTKRKFLFVKTDDWTSLVKEIFSYNLKSLNKNGTLCIACDIDTKPDICEIPPELLKQINNVPSRRMKINEAISSPIEEISIQHIHNFQKKFIVNQSVLLGLNIDKIEEKVKDEARSTFREN